MSRGFLLDTHVWAWYLTDDPLIASAASALDRAADEDRLYIAAVSLYELANSVRRKRIVLTMSPEEWFYGLLRPPAVRIVALSPEIAIATTRLPDNFHGDPGDRQIAATAISEDLTLCTHDHALIRFGEQGLYEFLEI